MYRRIPQSVAEATSENVLKLSTNTSGGRLRFKTNSSFVAISTKMKGAITMQSKFSLTGGAGFDLYVNNEYGATFIPPMDMTDGYESIFDFKTKKERDIMINFPTYSDVTELYIGLEDDAKITSHSPYRDIKPIVYYGSSITQGGCASRPGNTYQSVIARKLNIDYTCLGFSGSARAEKAIYEYIASLPMSAFVYDYDHNAPDAQFLKDTHKTMFDYIRKAQPNLPIIMLSSPSQWAETPDEIERRKQVIYDTYKSAKDSGNENVYFIDGQAIFNSFDSSMMTVDRIHPNDFGFWCMSEAILEVLRKIF